MRAFSQQPLKFLKNHFFELLITCYAAACKGGVDFRGTKGARHSVELFEPNTQLVFVFAR